MGLVLLSWSANSIAGMSPQDIVRAYYAAYNEKNTDQLSALMMADVVYEPNQGKKMTGSDKYKEYVADTFKTVEEKCNDLVVYSSSRSKKIVAKTNVSGKYIKDVEGYPKAHGQSYKIQVLEVFEIVDSKIKSLSTYYNEKDWVAQISR